MYLHETFLESHKKLITSTFVSQVHLELTYFNIYHVLLQSFSLSSGHSLYQVLFFLKVRYLLRHNITAFCSPVAT